MNHHQAKEIIRNTFQNAFDRDQYIGFIRNLLNKIDETKAFKLHGQFIKEAFRDFVFKYERIGTYTDPDGKKIDLLIVFLKKESTLDRARTTLRNFIANYLKNREGKDAGLIAFVSPNYEEWRFSFVKMDYQLTETQKGHIKAVENFTPAKRYSFLVGSHESSHTAQRSLLPILEDDEKNPRLDDIEKAFYVEKVTKEFFEKYRDLFFELKKALDDLINSDPAVAKDFNDKSIDTADFSKKLLGQIVFLYFLQKKGWFGVKKGEEWGGGSKHFLRELFKKIHGEYENFFNDVLEPLFYEALSIRRRDDYYSRFKCRIPFLNGGLFDPLKDYDWQYTDVFLPNDLFSNRIQTPEGDIGNGILDIFDRYNFTVNEDEPLEREVAVDPEMLGKVFENLLAIKDRKSKGTYYTPREIVHYMCQESLSNYLTTELQGKVTKEEIDILIRYGESVVEQESRVEKVGKETKDYFKILPDSIRKYAKTIDKKLSIIRVCDPAVGSGAFPVGMMNEIVRTRTALNPFFQEGERSVYGFKRNAIQNCLYGVDIDPGAVEIAKLRLWLSLIVDEEDIQNIRPLPNLDYKIVAGNSLLRVERTAFNWLDFKELENLKLVFFDETDPEKKTDHKKQIDALISQITNGHKDFDFEVYFSEVFHGNKGFDIVLGNPPYIEFKKLHSEDKKKYSNYGSAMGKYDIYVLFIELSKKLLGDKGVIAYINPTTFMKKDFGKSIRKIINANFTIFSIFDFCDLQIFESATNYTGIFLFQKGQAETYEFPYHKYKNTFSNISPEDFTASLYSLCSSPFKDLIIVNNLMLANSSWNFQKTELQSLFHKVSMNTMPLEHYTSEIFQGIASGKDSVFYITQDKIRELNLEKEIIFPLLKGKDIKAYCPIWSGYCVIYPYDCNSRVIPENVLKRKFPNIYKYLVTQKSNLLGRDYFDNSTKLWYELWNQRKFKNFKKLRIISPEISDKNNFVLEQDFFGNTKSYHIILKNDDYERYLYFLGLLNSKLLDFVYKLIATPQAGGFYAYKTQFLKRIPVKLPPNNQFVRFCDLVRDILAISKDRQTKQKEVRTIENKINQMVYELYGLSNDEIKIVEESI